MKISYGISIIWLSFAVIFLILGVSHYSESSNKISHFQVSERPVKDVKIKIKGASIDKPLKDFVKDFNSYIDNYNESSRKQNFHASLGYFAAAATAFLSMFLSFRGSKKSEVKSCIISSNDDLR